MQLNRAAHGHTAITLSESELASDSELNLESNNEFGTHLKRNDAIASHHSLDFMRTHYLKVNLHLILN